MSAIADRCQRAGVAFLKSNVCWRCKQVRFFFGGVRKGLRGEGETRGKKRARRKKKAGMEDRLSQKSTNFTQEANFTRRAQASCNFGIRAAEKSADTKILNPLLLVKIVSF